MSRPIPDLDYMHRLLEQLGDDGLEAVWVDRAPVFDKTSLLHAIYQAIPLTGDFGFNWDALEDSLFGPEDPNAKPRVLVFRDFDLLEERDPATARVFLDIVQSVAGNPASTLRGIIRARNPRAD